MKLSSEWNIQQKISIVHVTKLDAQHMVPLYEIFIGQSLRFQIYMVYILNLYNVCQGIQDNLYVDYSLLVKHSIPKIFIPFQENELPLHESIFYRSNK